MDWNDLRYALAIARAGTLAGAARRLDVDQTTVARRLAALEAALGASLFLRSDGRLRPTAAGELAVTRAARVEQEVEALANVATAPALVSGTVRLSAVPILVNHVLMPALPKLLTPHPALRLDLIAEGRNLSLSRLQADIVLRLGRPQAEAAALARRLGTLDFAPYAARGRKAASLSWIGYEEGSQHLPQAQWLAHAPSEPRAGFAVNDVQSALAAVKAGLGKSLLPCRVADADADLERSEAGGPFPSREVWLMTRRDIRKEARIETVIGWLDGLDWRS
jgi:DNA-binding transcriptional LysR family regulator